jgi:hypothetical protein
MIPRNELNPITVSDNAIQTKTKCAEKIIVVEVKRKCEGQYPLGPASLLTGTGAECGNCNFRLTGCCVVDQGNVEPSIRK